MLTFSTTKLFGFIVADASSKRYSPDNKIKLYYKLIEHGYSALFIELDVPAGEKLADLVIYNDYEHKEPKLLIECLPAGATIEDVARARKRAKEKSQILNCPRWARAIGSDLLEEEYWDPDFK